MRIHHRDKLNINKIVDDNLKHFEKKWYIKKTIVINDKNIDLNGYFKTNALNINDFPNKLNGNLRVFTHNNKIIGLFNIGFGESGNFVIFNDNRNQNFDFNVNLNLNDCINNLYNTNILNDNIILVE